MKAKHDEDAIFSARVAELSASPPANHRGSTGFVVAFKGVFLEGLEGVVIVLTLGTAAHHLGPAAAAATAAGVVVAGFGRFWWEFLVGDTPELFVGAVFVVGLVAVACIDHQLRTVAVLVLPLLVAAALAGSVWKVGRPPG